MWNESLLENNLHSFLIRSTGKTEAGCIRIVRRGTVQMHCWYHAIWSEATILHQMLLSGEEKKLPLNHLSSALFCLGILWPGQMWSSLIIFFSNFCVFMRRRVLRSLFQILSQFWRVIQTKNPKDSSQDVNRYCISAKCLGDKFWTCL